MLSDVLVKETFPKENINGAQRRMIWNDFRFLKELQFDVNVRSYYYYFLCAIHWGLKCGVIH